MPERFTEVIMVRKAIGSDGIIDIVESFITYLLYILDIYKP